MNEIEAIDRLLFQCDLPSALPDEVKREIIRSKKTVLINILKQAGKYTVSLAVILNIALMLKKIGIGVSAAKIGVAVHTVAVLAAATTVAGTGTVIYRAVVTETPVETVSTAPAVPDEKIEAPLTGGKSAVPARVISIATFTGKDELSREISEVRDGLFKAISDETDPGAVVLSSGDDVDSRLILSGSISLISGIYYVRVRLVESESSRIIAAVNKTAQSEQELKEVSKSIADEIMPHLK